MKSYLLKLMPCLFACLFTLAPFLAHAQNSTSFGWNQPIPADPLGPLKKLPADQAKALKEKALAELKTQYDLKSSPFSETKAAFDLKGHTVKQRLLKGGGGVVDGGGGNLSSQNGEMLDRYQYDNLEKIDPRELKSLIEKYYDSRIQLIESETPGFKTWLELALEKPWFLDTKPFDKSICPLAETGTCQSADAVHLNREIFNKATEAKRADMILSELFMRSVRELSIDKKAQFLGEIKKRFLSPQVKPQQLYGFFVQNDILNSKEQTELTRARFVSEFDSQLVPLKKTISDFLIACQQMPMDFSKSFYKAVGQYMDYSKKCHQWLRPEVDGQACEVESIAEMVVAFKLSKCVKP